MDKELVKIVVVGHVDHGKSTVIGRLLFDTNSLPEGTVEKVRKIARDTGKPFEYAYLLDAFEEEQKQGITIDTTQIQFNTSKREYVIIDAPGHKEFLKNMISGAANAEAALLVIDGKEGVQEQSKRHAYILSLLGIKKVYVIVNKMDLIDYSEKSFNNITKEMGNFLKELNIFPLSYIPVSAFYGENILNKSNKMDWFKGDSIIKAIDSIEKDKGIEKKPLRFPIQDVYKFDHRRIIAGRIESGTINIGDEIIIYPEGKKTKVKSIEYWASRDKKDTVIAGNSVGITVEDEFFNKRGEVISKIENPPIVSNTFRANLFWMGRNDLLVNKKYKIKLTTQEVEGEIEKIIKVVDASSLESHEESKKVALNDVAEVIIKTKDSLIFDEFSESSITGRFVIVDGYDVAGGGIIIENEEVSEIAKPTFFKEGKIVARGDIFDEFYYNVKNYSVEKTYNYNDVYRIGDELPLKGESFNYPSYVDILVLRDGVAVRVRNGKVTVIEKISKYNYEGYPVINGRGFGISINSNDDLAVLLNEYSNVKEEESYSDFSNRWFVFDEYRKLVFNKIS
ncbi:sulfate adenylyltransferase subunit 1 [Clostridium paraputrificum]|uniref:sulfate adenylyltransferase subunit 1 n=1 Tax=Clostridium TaxID=1485 RepID=UPI003D32845F